MEESAAKRKRCDVVGAKENQKQWCFRGQRWGLFRRREGHTDSKALDRTRKVKMALAPGSYY